MVRVTAIAYSLLYGLFPYWVYERKCHYDCTYLQHLVINLKYSWRWLSFQEYESDVEFEKITNNNF